MLDDNTGWRSLSAIISLVRIKGADMSAYESWCERRSGEVKDVLDRICRRPEVRYFIDRYAEAQAARIRALLGAADVATAGDILIDLHEELLRQAMRYNDYVAARSICESRQTQPEAHVIDQDPAANQNLAMAA